MEQGPILEAEKIPLGVVKGIAGQARYSVTISGVQVRKALINEYSSPWESEKLFQRQIHLL